MAKAFWLRVSGRLNGERWSVKIDIRNETKVELLIASLIRLRWGKHFKAPWCNGSTFQWDEGRA
jgi:hypothetical protein